MKTLELKYEDSDTNLIVWSCPNIENAKFPVTTTSEDDTIIYTRADLEKIKVFIDSALGITYNY